MEWSGKETFSCTLKGYDVLIWYWRTPDFVIIFWEQMPLGSVRERLFIWQEHHWERLWPIERTIAYGISRCFSATERRYGPTEREAHAIMWAITQTFRASRIIISLRKALLHTHNNYRWHTDSHHALNYDVPPGILLAWVSFLGFRSRMISLERIVVTTFHLPHPGT